MTLLRPAPRPALAGRPALSGRGERFPPVRVGPRIDLVLVGVVVALCTAGSVLVYSATRPRLQAAGADGESLLVRHLVSIGLGLLLAVVVACADYRRLRMYTPPVYVLGIAGLALVLSPLGATINGSHSWILLGGFSLQPVEFAKLALCLGLALLLAERREGTWNVFPHREVFLAVGIAAIPVGLVALQPDLGSIMVLVAVLAGVLVVAAVPVLWLVGLAMSTLLGAFVAIQANLLSEYQVNRFAAFANPALDPDGVGYNANQAKIAVGSGGLTGTGLFHGTQTGGRFVPEQHTDFIFTAVGEQLGLLGSALLLTLFALVAWRTWRSAALAKDAAGTLICVGVLAMLTFQIFENVGMTMGIMPITGIPLPFLSYGGSSTIATYAAMGLVLNVHMRRFT
jgi:rod shape determining protein RodA